MVKYELRKNIREIRFKDRNEIKTGCTLQQDNQEPEIIKSFDKKEDALKEQASYQSEIYPFGSYFSVTEYYVEENEYDEDGEWVAGGDVWDFAPLPELEE